MSSRVLLHRSALCRRLNRDFDWMWFRGRVRCSFDRLMPNQRRLFHSGSHCGFRGFGGKLWLMHGPAQVGVHDDLAVIA